MAIYSTGGFVMQSIFYASAYSRTSKDDIDSSSIENQITLIRNYVKSMPNIRIISEREDNGFSGIDFLRPDFRKMMTDIESGKVNCVIVKDLSRLGRNYIEVGELMDEIFPKLNARLIAINDNYDSINPRSDADEILIPFKNLMNEQYARDTSGKIRSILSSKREKGQFVSAFAPYGYKRDENNRHQLVIDEHAANIVRDIFRYKVEGMSQQRISERLNKLGEPSPAEYKKRDTNYVAQFQTHSRASWSAVAVGRILRNPVYIGVLIQGMQTTPNYKVKQRINRSENEWNIINDAHESIISKSDFEIVNSLLNQDTRTAPNQETVYPLSGMVYCGDCGNNMVRTKSGLIYYYVCASSRAKNKTCTSHCIQEEKLLNTVRETICRQIVYALDVERTLVYVKSLSSQQKETVKLNAQLADREQEIKSCERYKRSLYEDYKNKLISKEDYIQFGNDYTMRINELQQAVVSLKEEVSLLINDNSSSCDWLKHFTQHKGIQSLTRQLTVNLVEQIKVFTGKRVTVSFRYQDKMEFVQKIIDKLLHQQGRNIKLQQITLLRGGDLLVEG